MYRYQNVVKEILTWLISSIKQSIVEDMINIRATLANFSYQSSVVERYKLWYLCCSSAVYCLIR